LKPSIIDGKRTLAEQKALVAKGASKTMRSRHLSGKAVDIMALVNGKGRWEGALYYKIATHVLSIAKKLDIKITWGGSWSSFPDLGHFELDKNTYGY
jgi:peptidoglycan L-alanyl-D-glutamate endopeptidase CwlK